jgi:CRP-like cAMP-binding protein
MTKKKKSFLSSGFWTNVLRSDASGDDLYQSIQAIPPFQSLTRKETLELLEMTHHRRFKPDEYVFYQNDPGLGLYIIREGEIEIEIETPSGRALILAALGPSDFFGELALLEGETRTASARARREALTAVIFKPDLEEFIRRHPKTGVSILNGFLKIVIARLRALDQDYIKLYDTAVSDREIVHETRVSKNINPY